MGELQPADPGYETRVRKSFERHVFMHTIGARLAAVGPGRVTIELPFRNDLTQQHGFLHAGIVTSIVDTACGYAAISLMPADTTVLTAEFKTNFMAPAAGERLRADARVTKSGRTLTVCAGDVFAITDARERLVATMLATMMAVKTRPDFQD